MILKKVFVTLMVATTLFGANITEAANIREYPRVAIMNFGNKAITSSGLRAHDFSSATEYAIYQLSACGWFDLVDYEQLSTVANMHSINMSGLVDPSTVVQMGKFVGAQFMVVGNVTGLTTKENVFGYQHGNVGGLSNAQHVVTANVAVRIVDIETGRIIVAGLGKGSSTSTNTELNFKKYRNRKIETENISDTVTTDKRNEYTKNENASHNRTENQFESNNTSITSENNTSNSKTDESNDNTSTSLDTVVTKSPSATLKGDVNCDGVVDNADLVALEGHIVGTYSGEFDSYNADLDDDGTPNLTDVSKLRLMIENATGGKIYPDMVPDNETVTNNTSNSKNNTITNNTTVSNVDRKESTSSNNRTINDESSENVTTTTDVADNVNRVLRNDKSIYYERETEDYRITIGTVEVSDIQVRNAISKAVRDAIYGNMGIMTTLNNGKKLKIKTGF